MMKSKLFELGEGLDTIEVDVSSRAACEETLSIGVHQFITKQAYAVTQKVCPYFRVQPEMIELNALRLSFAASCVRLAALDGTSKEEMIATAVAIIAQDMELLYNAQNANEGPGPQPTAPGSNSVN